MAGWAWPQERWRRRWLRGSRNTNVELGIRLETKPVHRVLELAEKRRKPCAPFVGFTLSLESRNILAVVAAGREIVTVVTAFDNLPTDIPVRRRSGGQ